MNKEKVFIKNPKRPAFISVSKRWPVRQFSTLHVHPEFEIIQVNSGQMGCTVVDSLVILDKGDIIFVNSNVPHATQSTKNDTSSTLVQFKNPKSESATDYFATVGNESVLYKVFKNGEEANKEFSSFIDVMKKYHTEDSTEGDCYITANIYSICGLLYKTGTLSKGEKLDSDNLKKLLPVLDYIEENFDSPITLEQTAKILNMNKDYFCRLFKKGTGVTLGEYVNFIRITKAEDLMKTDMSISEIAYKTGFSSLSYFNKVFKKQKRYTPSAYRKITSRYDGHKTK